MVREKLPSITAEKSTQTSKTSKQQKNTRHGKSKEALEYRLEKYNADVENEDKMFKQFKEEADWALEELDDQKTKFGRDYRGWPATNLLKSTLQRKSQQSKTIAKSTISTQT